VGKGQGGGENEAVIKRARERPDMADCIIDSGKEWQQANDPRF